MLALRGTFVLMDHFDAGLMLELFESEKGNATLIVPTMILGLLDHPDRPLIHFGDRTLTVGEVGEQVEAVAAALSGKREDIPKVLAEHVDKIHRAATGN